MHTKIVYFWYAKGGEDLCEKKMGRPTDKPKTTQLAIRFDVETLAILDSYCKQNGISRAEGIRVAVGLLKDK